MKSDENTPLTVSNLLIGWQVANPPLEQVCACPWLHQAGAGGLHGDLWPGPGDQRWERREGPVGTVVGGLPTGTSTEHTHIQGCTESSFRFWKPRILGFLTGFDFCWTSAHGLKQTLYHVSAHAGHCRFSSALWVNIRQMQWSTRFTRLILQHRQCVTSFLQRNYLTGTMDAPIMLPEQTCKHSVMDVHCCASELGSQGFGHETQLIDLTRPPHNDLTPSFTVHTFSDVHYN